jgi:hypothetical protein
MSGFTSQILWRITQKLLYKGNASSISLFMYVYEYVTIQNTNRSVPSYFRAT